jgi:hypothetical protein
MWHDAFTMKLAAVLIALALAAPAESQAQVFRSEATMKAKGKKAPKAQKARRSRNKTQAAPKAPKTSAKSRSEGKDSSLSDSDVVVIIEGQ